MKRSVYDIETAFEAHFTVGEGGRTIAYNAEYGTPPLPSVLLLLH